VATAFTVLLEVVLMCSCYEEDTQAGHAVTCLLPYTIYGLQLVSPWTRVVRDATQVEMLQADVGTIHFYALYFASVSNGW